MRDRLGDAIDKTTSGRDLAALTKRLAYVTVELAALDDPAADETPLEQMRRRRAARAARRNPDDERLADDPY